MSSRKVLLSSLLLVQISAFCQERPVLKQQVSLDEVENVISDSRQNTLLANTASGYTLIDQQSKIQLGTIQLELDNSSAIPGAGKTYLWGDSSFILSTGRVLLKVDPVTAKWDTLFNRLQFPEFIINYMPAPWDEHILLIASKIYPVEKGIVSMMKSKNGKMVYDDSKNCRLHLFDTRTGTLQSVTTKHAITAMMEGSAGNIIAGTFDGDIIEIDNKLAITERWHAFDFPVHSVVRQNDILLAVPHIAPKYISASGQGTFYVYNLATKEQRRIELPVQEPLEKKEWGIQASPTNNISRVFSYPQENSVLINYGFRGLMRVGLPGLDTAQQPVPGANEINFYCFNRDSSQLVAAVSGEASIFGPSGDLEAYDLSTKKFQTALRKATVKEEYGKLYKLFDSEGNYHFVGIRKSNDTVVVFPSNRSVPVVLTGNCQFMVNEVDTTLLLTKGRHVINGKLLLNNLVLNEYQFNFETYSGSSDRLNNDIYKVMIDTRKFAENSLPRYIDKVFEIGEGKQLISGTMPGKENTTVWIGMIDSTGKLLWKTVGMETAIGGNSACISPSKNLLAFEYAKNNIEILEVWDLRAGKKLLEKQFPKRNLGSFAFDKTKDVFWYSRTFEDKPYDLFKLEFNGAAPQEKLMFSHNCLSFQTDMANDLIASELYDQLYLHRLSDRKLLWERTPASNSFHVFSQPNGFAFASETEYYVINNDGSHLYFTSFQGHKPVEILNDYIYKGEKSTINNLAFTLKRKAYMPGDYDMYFNRPDSILKRSGSTNAAFNEMMAKAVEKRRKHYPAKKLEEVLSASPQFALNNGDEIKDVISSPEIKLSVKAKSVSGKPIAAWHVLDNGVPVFGRAGLPVKEKSFEAETSLTVPLVPDRNSLQVYATDAEGNISYSENISVVGDFNATASKTYFVGIGINQFADSKNNLSYSVKDIRDLALNLKGKYGDNVVIDTLFDQQVTISNVTDLKKRLLSTSVNDKVILSYSGHGLLSKDFDYYLSTYNVNFQKPEENGLPYDALESLLDGIPARQKLMLIDACHSGEVDKEEMQKYRTVVKEKAGEGLKGLDIENTDTTARVGMKNSFELMQELFVNTGRSTGATIISAAAGTQLAQERGDLKNGVFTYSILEFMKENPTATVTKLKQYVNKRVPELTNGLQVPTTRSESKAAEWKVW